MNYLCFATAVVAIDVTVSRPKFRTVTIQVPADSDSDFVWPLFSPMAFPPMVFPSMVFPPFAPFAPWFWDTESFQDSFATNWNNMATSMYLNSINMNNSINSMFHPRGGIRYSDRS